MTYEIFWQRGSILIVKMESNLGYIFDTKKQVRQTSHFLSEKVKFCNKFNECLQYKGCHDKKKKKKTFVTFSLFHPHLK